jgi:hypothetical protein
MDNVFTGFLEDQMKEGMSLAARSELLTLLPAGGTPPSRYVARFTCRGLVRVRGGVVVEAECFEVGIWFPPDYLRRVNPLEVVSWLGPDDAYHPNIGPGPGNRIFICVGNLSVGTSLVEILMQCFEIITYQKITMREDDAVNHEACAWARANQDRFPIDRRTLLGRTIATQDLSSSAEERQ